MRRITGARQSRVGGEVVNLRTAVVAMFGVGAISVFPFRGAAQTIQSADDAKLLRFEAATIKRNVIRSNARHPSATGGSFSAVGLTASELIRLAFSPIRRPLFATQVAGGPNWINPDKFDVVAKAPEQDGTPSMLTMVGMLRNLLFDRIKLVTHTEQRELPIYALLLAREDGRLGPGLRRTTGDCGGMGNRPPTDATNLCGFQHAAPGAISAKGFAMTAVAAELSCRPEVQRPVQDRTGLSDTYDLDRNYAPVLPPAADSAASQRDDNRANLFTALQQQLGLKRQPQEAPADALVIDLIDRPDPD